MDINFDYDQEIERRGHPENFEPSIHKNPKSDLEYAWNAGMYKGLYEGEKKKVAALKAHIEFLEKALDALRED